MIKPFFLFLPVIFGFYYTNRVTAIPGDNKTITLVSKNNHTGIYKDTIMKKSKTVYDAAAIEKNARLINLEFDADHGNIKINSTELVEDDAPASGQPEGYNDCCGKVAWIEDLSRGIIIKKILNVENPSALSARLVFSGLEVKGNTSSLHISLNGTEIIRPASEIAYPFARQYFDSAFSWDHWYFVDLPLNKVRKGNNEILMWTESDTTSWRILVADATEFKRGSLTRTSPNRSLKSSDGGNTWSDSKLGALNAIGGEYSVRFSLDHFLSAGEYISPLLDLVNDDHPLKINSLDVKAVFIAEFLTPAHTGTEAWIRFGATPYMGDNSWTDWESLENNKEYNLKDKKYMQWKVKLFTNDPLVTPGIKSFTITSSWKENSLNQNTGLSAHVIHNGEIVEPSFTYSYENLNHPDLKKYREAYQLDRIVAGANSEFEVILRLLNWAYRVPLTFNGYSWNWNDVVAKPTYDKQQENTNSKKDPPMPKLNGPFFDQRRMVGMCLFPTQALIGALLSMGLQARHVNINSEAMNGHEITEVWSNDFNKWVYLDPTLDTYYFDLKTGIPLNVLDIHQQLVSNMPRIETWQHPFAVDIAAEVVSKIHIGIRQGNNPFSILTSPGENGGGWAFGTIGHFRIIPRNDFLSHPLPVPVHTGATSWGWDGFLNWYDKIFPKRDEFQNHSNRAIDFYQPLNQVKIFLNETDEAGTLRVDLKNFTPGGFDRYLVSVNSDDWKFQKDNTWNWKLRSGKNIIKVRTRNIRGILGPVSEIDVNYNP